LNNNVKNKNPITSFLTSILNSVWNEENFIFCKIFFSTKTEADFKSCLFYLIMFGSELEISSIIWVYTGKLLPEKYTQFRSVY
jgi:hypothetical protein